MWQGRGMKNAILGIMAVVVCGVGLGGCQPTPKPTEVLEREAASTSPALEKTAPVSPELVRWRSRGRVAAIGDVHGDLAATRAALRLAKAIDATDQWVGGDLFVVQTGDHLDRGDDEPEIAQLFERLEKEAAAAGGAFIALQGNHELMNAAGDFRYVTADGFADFGGPDGRAGAFAPGGKAAKRLAELPLYAIVDDVIYTHAGVSPRDVAAGLAMIDAEARAWLRGEVKEIPRAVVDPEGIVWTRRYGRAPGPEDCAAAATVLEQLQLKAMVVGHSPQAHVNAVCEGTVWRIDVGMARHYGGPVEILMIEDGEARAVAIEGAP